MEDPIGDLWETANRRLIPRDAKPTTKWEQVKDAYRVHERLLNASGAALGEYYEVQSGDVRAVCYPDGKLVSLKTEQDARAFVQRCEVWQ